MTRSPREIDDALSYVRPAWTAGRAAEVQRRMERNLRVRARRRRTVVFAGGVGLVAAAAAILLIPRLLRTPTEAPVATTPATNELRLADGSTAAPLDEGSALEIAEMSRTRRVVRILRGGARFDVRNAPDRIFRVELRGVAVEVLGTAFTVEERREGVRVAVERGRVRVRWGESTALLVPGEARLFPADERAPERPQRVQRVAAARATPVETPESLLTAADRARQSGRPADAVPPLERFMARFADDPRASLAAFTLGLVHLERLGRPHEAARAFARAQRLDSSGELREDALAREVEAWYRAGDPGRARARAMTYLDRYPDGRRATSVRKHGGLR